MIEGKTRFVPELSKEEELQLIENATPGNTKKATKYGIKIFQEPLLEEKSNLSQTESFPALCQQRVGCENICCARISQMSRKNNNKLPLTLISKVSKRF